VSLKNYFAATAYDTDGYESDYSEEVIRTIPAATDIQLLAPENGLTIPDAPVFEWGLKILMFIRYRFQTME
jgi:hypothetical protein